MKVLWPVSRKKSSGKVRGTFLLLFSPTPSAWFNKCAKVPHFRVVCPEFQHQPNLYLYIEKAIAFSKLPSRFYWSHWLVLGPMDSFPILKARKLDNKICIFGLKYKWFFFVILHNNKNNSGREEKRKVSALLSYSIFSPPYMTISVLFLQNGIPFLNFIAL